MNDFRLWMQTKEELEQENSYVIKPHVTSSVQEIFSMAHNYFCL